jgi:hypothetical protein
VRSSILDEVLARWQALRDYEMATLAMYGSVLT